jgi:hypothetical protein
MSRSVRIENVVLCYPHLYEKHAPPGTTNARYSAEFLLDPIAQQQSCHAVEQAFKEVAIEAGKGDSLQYLKSPLKDGDELNQLAASKGKNPRPELAGKRVIRAGDPNYAPSVVNRDLQPIPESQKSQVFGGCIVNAFVDLYWSSNQANPGVFVGLRGVQLVDNVNVTPLGGGVKSAEDMFVKVDGPDPIQPVQETGPSQPDFL